MLFIDQMSKFPSFGRITNGPTAASQGISLVILDNELTHRLQWSVYMLMKEGHINRPNVSYDSDGFR
jgi:hypothetical protein